MWTSGAEVLCSGGGLFLAEEAVLSVEVEDARAGEETGFMAGALGCAGDAEFSACGVALELAACSGTSGALRRKNMLETKKKRCRK
jgi:hypothetical protein